MDEISKSAHEAMVQVGLTQAYNFIISNQKDEINKFFLETVQLKQDIVKLAHCVTELRDQNRALTLVVTEQKEYYEQELRKHYNDAETEEHMEAARDNLKKMIHCIDMNKD